MRKTFLHNLIAGLFGRGAIQRGRRLTCDTSSMAFGFRMGAGFAGDVNRTHPFSVEPNLICVATPPTALGQAVLDAAANAGVRPFGAGDGAAVDMAGVTVRAYPTQQTTGGMSSAFGSVTPPTSGVTDVLREGYIMVKIPVAEAAVAAKGGAVFVRCAAAAADDPVGGFKAQADGGNTAALSAIRYTFNGPADAAGIVELRVRI